MSSKILTCFRKVYNVKQQVQAKIKNVKPI